MKLEIEITHEKDCKNFVKFGTNTGDAIVTVYVRPAQLKAANLDSSKPITVTLSQEGGAS